METEKRSVFQEKEMSMSQALPPELTRLDEDRTREGGNGFRDEVFEVFAEFFCREQPVGLKSLMESLEKRIVIKVLHDVKGNQKDAAKLLGIKCTTLNEKLKKHKIRVHKQAVIFRS